MKRHRKTPLGLVPAMALGLAWLLAPALHADRVEAPEDPEAVQPQRPMIELSPVVRRLLDDPITTDAERRQLRVFHGQWEALADPTPAERAAIALQKFAVADTVFGDASVPAMLRAQAAVVRGDAAEALELLAEEEDSAETALVRAEALELLGRTGEAIAALEPWRERLRREELSGASALVAGAEALVKLAELEGRPAQDYQLAMSLLARARERYDRLYWPAHLAEGRLLMGKDNRPQAAEALMEALQLNPSLCEAWYLLGTMAVQGYDFHRAGQAVDMLRRIDEQSVLADMLETQSLLQQRDARNARAVVEVGLTRLPRNLWLLSLLAATDALAYDEPALNATLAHIETIYPGSAMPYRVVGEYLATTRQYDWSERILREAVRRRPNWPEPRVELGLLLMQAGDIDAAQRELRDAARLDPFNRRAANQLRLVEELIDYQTIETDNFIIRFRPGIDEVLARDMPDELERIYREVTGVFEHRPRNRTQIDIMPDEQWFGVRITGMPEIWTIAAATGDVISITPPRDGPRQRGIYDWANVLRHEFVHTVTLDQTDNRVPHWFTEACAVSQELTGRDYNTCRLLASALHADRLFGLDTINWGFIRPRTPTDRPLAYAQADWMLEYLAVAHGHQTIVRMLELFREGRTDIEALHMTTGQTADQFMDGFKAWASEQVQQWGLAPPTDERLVALLSKLSRQEPVEQEQIDALLRVHPNQPDLLRLVAERALDEQAADARQRVLRYAAARPVDPWPHKVLVQLGARGGELGEVIGSLEALDRIENHSGSWAHQLAQIHRQLDQLPQAADAIERALRREPYNATYRELAATIALQRRDMAVALRQLEAMTLLEPDRSVHFVRLAALHHRMGQVDEARAAATRARQIDPEANVETFLQP